jgi:Flp pilus assembly CpaF family ATPase
MASLGWRLLEGKAGYRLALPKLSEEECGLVLACAKRIASRAETTEAPGTAGARQAALDAVLLECERQGLEIDSEQREYLASSVYRKTYGLGFLDELLADGSLEEIALCGIGKPVFVFARKEGWKRTNVCIDSQDYFVSLVNRLGRGLGRRLTAQQPRLNATLPDGSRLHASMPPVSECELTIRKFGPEPLSAFDLIGLGTYDAKMLSLLSLCMQSDMAVLVCGNTASGKTTTLNALLSFLPSSERILIIEETPEISIPHPHQVRLLPFEEGGIGMVWLVRDSLRMRPDRVVVGEVRSSEEAKAFAESALSGQAKGSYATFHAQSSRDAMARLSMMGCLESDLEGIGLFIVQRRVSVYDRARRKIGEQRKVTEIAIANPESPMKPMPVHIGGRFTPALRMLHSGICKGTGMGMGEVRKELALREGFFRQGIGKGGAQGPAAFGRIQEFLFGGGK